MSRDISFPTMWYVRPAKTQISLRIHAVWPEPLLVVWIFYACYATDRTSFGVSKHKRRLYRQWHIVGNHMSLLQLKFLWYRNFRSRVAAPAGLFYFLILRAFIEILLSIFIRCSVPGVVLIESIPDICLLPYFFFLTRVPSHKIYRILYYSLRSNSGWLPIRCAYFIWFIWVRSLSIYVFIWISIICQIVNGAFNMIWHKVHPVPTIL